MDSLLSMSSLLEIKKKFSADECVIWGVYFYSQKKEFLTFRHDHEMPDISWFKGILEPYWSNIYQIQENIVRKNGFPTTEIPDYWKYKKFGSNELFFRNNDFQIKILFENQKFLEIFETDFQKEYGELILNN